MSAIYSAVHSFPKEIMRAFLCTRSQSVSRGALRDLKRDGTTNKHTQCEMPHCTFIGLAALGNNCYVGSLYHIPTVLLQGYLFS